MTLDAAEPVRADDAPDPLDAAHRSIEYMYERGWTDGLPVVPATRELVDAFLATTSRSPEEVIGRLDHLKRQVTVEVAAINAVMAGCRPEYFPVVLAAWDALMAERSTVGGGWQSTSGPAPLIVVNGPVRARLGFNSTGGVFGPGFRANATVARTIGLIVRNPLGVVPHVLEQATQGVPGRWAMCVAENEEESPWEPFSVDGGVAAGVDAVSTTLVRTSEFVDNRHTGDPELLLGDFADTIARTGSWIFRHASAGVVFCPEHAQMLAAAGMSKADVRGWLLERSGRSKAELARAGKNGLSGNVRRQDDDGELEGFDRFFADDSPRNLPIIVAGARNAGISMVVRVFSSWSGAAVRIEPPR
ncbi:hypothetical protein HNP84_009027 [Thermocatellispora tengchongensis]|uniref:Thioredoxin n=1 Tax=Thermocatellispora tengchongensis TaxID=1073253 RepID=A0A840PCX3_9ACTN|nr:hypothetical protein [Thermocatellispora tengchongensis]MBB5139264.1 hypothetical protein [Thermocatellispora tengchongensis]